MRKGLRIAALIFYNCVVIVVVFGGAEYAARSIQFKRHGPLSQQPESRRDWYAAFRNNPRFGTTRVHHNSQGFRRETELPLVKPETTSRIFLLGGSVTYGGESLYGEIESRPPPADNETIDHYLEDRLNAAFPDRRWEVINAGVKGYLLHQDLALLVSAIMRYKPDYVISIDGVNDLSSLLRAPPHYDPYLMPEQIADFDNLANPRSAASVRAFLSTWLRNDSVLFRVVQDWMADRIRRRRRQVKASGTEVKAPLRFEDLAPEAQAQYRVSEAQLETYIHTLRQMHQILAMDGVRDLFVLQPEIAVSRKRQTEMEQRLDIFHRKIESRLFVFGFESLYPVLARMIDRDATRSGYQFLNLTDLFDAVDTQAFTDYCHLTSEGNRLVADRIFQALRPSM